VTTCSQDNTLGMAREAVRVGYEGKEAAEAALAKQKENQDISRKINEEAEELQAAYQISFGLMFQIVRGLACDQCFQVLIGLLVVGILTLLVVNFTM